MDPFEQSSYSAHESHLDEMMQNTGEKSPLYGLYNKNSVNYWRHKRMYQILDPFLADQDGSWLTVGDGCGWDANYIHAMGRSVYASDLSDRILKMAATQGLIGEFGVQNAEKLGFDADTFDYTVCKESYHHFPRPYIAVYELIRVAKKAVFFIEPQDPVIKSPLLLLIKNVLDRVSPDAINKLWKNRYSFETVGNYVYKISDREMEKIAMGLNLPAVAFRGINDVFENNPMIHHNEPNPWFFRKIRLKIALRNLACLLGLLPYQQLGCILFKSMPSETQIATMKRQGFHIQFLPKNPYI